MSLDVSGPARDDVGRSPTIAEASFLSVVVPSLPGGGFSPFHAFFLGEVCRVFGLSLCWDVWYWEGGCVNTSIEESLLSPLSLGRLPLLFLGRGHVDA